MKSWKAALNSATYFTQVPKEKATLAAKTGDKQPNNKQPTEAVPNPENADQNVTKVENNNVTAQNAEEQIPDDSTNDTQPQNQDTDQETELANSQSSDTSPKEAASGSTITTTHSDSPTYTNTTNNPLFEGALASATNITPSPHNNAFNIVYNSNLNSNLGSVPTTLAHNQTYTDAITPELVVVSDSKLSYQNIATDFRYFNLAPPINTVKFVTPEPNFFVKAAAAITGLLSPASEKPKATVVSVAGNDGDGQDTSTFIPIVPPAAPVPLISHEFAPSRSFSINVNTLTNINMLTFETTANTLFAVTPAALSPINASGTLATINLTGNATGITATPYGMRAATAPNNVALAVGGNANTPGTVLLSPTIATSLLVPGLIDLDFSPSNPTALFTSISVPTSIEAKVNVPAAAANAQLIFNFLAAPRTMTIVAEYTPGPDSHIVSIDPIQNLGTTFQTGVIISTNLDMSVIVYNHNIAAQQKLIFVDANNVVRGQGTFGVLANPGSLILQDDYNFVKPGDLNRDGFTDFLFGSEINDDVLLLYGKMGIPALIDLGNIPSTLSATKFTVPDTIVGTVLAEGAPLLDGGAALNALSATGSSLKFVGDVNGDGNVDFIIQRYSTNYAYDSDLVYVIEGQDAKFPSNVNLLPYGDTRLTQGIVGIGTDSEGNVIQQVKGFAITGTSMNNTVAPNNFAVTSVGDINGDGYSDLLAFSNNSTAYMVFGHPDVSTISSLINLGGNLNTGLNSRYLFKLFTLSGVADSTHVPSINDIDGGNLNGDGLNDIFLSSAISVDSLIQQTLPIQKYLTAFYDNNGTPVGSILSGAFFTDSSFNRAPWGSAYVYFDTVANKFDTSHVILGFNNQDILEGFTGIDSIIGGTVGQTLIEHAMGTTHPRMPGVIGSTLIGGQGNDVISVADAAFHEVRGGGGFNTLRLHSGTLDLSQAPDASASDLASRASQLVTGIQRIDLGDNTNFIIDPSHLLSISPILSQTLGTGISLITNSPTSITGTLLIASKNGPSQDPATAPSVTLIDNSDMHQWVANTPANVRFEGQSITTYTLLGTNTANQNVALATLVVENNVQSHVEGG